MPLPLNQKKLLDCDKSSSADTAWKLFSSSKRRDYEELNECQSSCESGDSSSCWSGDGQSNSSVSAMSVRPRPNQKHHHQWIGNDNKVFTCCLDRRRQQSSSSRWTEYEKRTATCSSNSTSWESVSDSLNDWHDASFLTGPLTAKVPNQR